MKAMTTRVQELVSVPAAQSSVTIPRRADRPRMGTGVRGRILAAYILLMVVSAAASLVLLRQFLLARLSEEINDHLAQEVQEFERLVNGTNPKTGRPFGPDLRAIADTYFSRNVPGEGELIFVIIDGAVYGSSRAHDASYRIERRSDVVRRWASLTDTRTGTLETPAGPLRHLSVPVRLGDRTLGTFVATNLPRAEHREIAAVVRTGSAVTMGVLLVASLLAWLAAGRVLAPLRLLSGTARSITESDLSARIPVEGRDELSELARRFNEMLERLEAAFAGQQRFVDDAGHELRTPITIIAGHLELLEEDPDQRRDTIALVMDELDRMQRIVNDLLVLARAQQPDFLELDVVDVEILGGELFKKATALAPRGWMLESLGTGRIVADRQRLTQAVMQLADNAARHTREGDTIALGTDVADGRARFWVRDTGPGVRRGDQERIFDRFARGAGPRSSGGAGLGLAIVRAIAEAHGGDVELRSSPGNGATFTLTLPVDQPPPVRDRP
jgi:signal transduction histidine kinase